MSENLRYEPVDFSDFIQLQKRLVFGKNRRWFWLWLKSGTNWRFDD